MNVFKKLRTEKGLTQEQLGAVLNVQKSTISKYEKGKASPAYDVLKKMSAFFGVSIDELIGNDAFSPISPKREATDLLSLLLRHSPAASEAMKNFRVDASGSILRNGEKVSDLSDPVLLAAAKMIYDRLSEAQAAGASSAHIDITRRP